MSIKFICGFEHQNITDDGFFLTSGNNFWAYSASTPGSSNGGRSMFYAPGLTGVYAGGCSSSVSSCWIGAQIKADNSATQILVGSSLGTSARFIEAGIVSGEWVIFINGTSEATASAAPLAQWNRIHLHIAGLSSGDVISLYRDGDLSSTVIQYTLTTADVSGWPASFTHASIYVRNGGGVDDLWIMDPTDATGVTDPQETLSFSVELLTANANGPDFTFATGSFSDVDEIPFNLSDKITADAVGQIADLSFTSATTAQVIGAIKVTQRTQRSGTTAGSQAEISIDDGSNNNAIETVTVPGDGYIRTYISDAADGTALEVSKLNASTIQIKTVT